MANICAIAEKHAIAQIASTGIDLISIRLRVDGKSESAGLSLGTIEALGLSLIGGLIGVGGSAIFAAVVGWAFTVAGYSILVGVGTAMVVGVFSGIYPAISAAHMNPVNALRSQ